jgi:CRISPR-associated endonuclease/helicase Cas3
LAAAEVLARRFGADGVFVGMPTQATCDPMFVRVKDWAQRVEPGTPVGLLHGKRRFNRHWRELLEQVRFVGIDEHADGLDEFGCGDEYGTVQGGYRRVEEAPAEWFLGPKRGLLMPVTVGTVDQLLHAATRTRHVMLRHVGLAGRVVILDEVHAYDVYMTQFLCEALRWLADAGVPVILLSATLPPVLRQQLATAYLQGATLERDIKPPIEIATEDGYPMVRSLCLDDDGVPRYDQRVEQPWRASVPVAVEVLGEGPTEGPDAVAALLADALADGGCALVVRNTVSRAQETYRAVKAAFGDDEVMLLHARLTVGERADRTEKVLGLLGPPDRADAVPRPHRLVVVATQLAEQSFDVDVDLLVTDLAPIDLLLQRVGRLHRHARPAGARPDRVNTPRVVVAGMKRKPDAAPEFPRGSVYVYGRHMLLRSAALVVEAADGSGWSIPEAVPALVRRGYGEDASLPTAWQADAAKAEAKWRDSQRDRAKSAAKFILAGEDTLGTQHLAGLHDIPTRDLNDDDAVAAVVRDGPESIEVILVREDDGCGLRTLDGRSIGVSGAAIHDPAVAEAVVESAVRLPPRPEITAAAKSQLAPLPECGDDPWLRRARVLVLDEQGAVTLGGRRFVYDPELGLLDEPAP